MLGLRPENDQGYYQSIQRTTPQFKKSGKFANQLTGRFFVSGISGSFAKHQKHLHEIKEHEIAQLNPPIESDQLLEDNTNNTNNNNNNNNEENNKPSVIPIRFLPHKKLVRKYTYQPVLEKRQREELRKDAQRLLELEEKLNEIQRIKSLKRQRDRQRRKRKAEYLAATTIQKTFRGYSVRSKQQAVDVLTDFLRSVQANQAIVKFLAALGIVKKFMKKKFPAWQKKHFLRKQAKEVAEDNWLIVTEVASILTAARREVTRDFLDTVFEISTENVMPQLIEEEKKRRELLKKKQSKKKKGKGMKKPEDFLQFFLTEFDRNADGTASDEDDDDEDDGDEEERSLEELEQDYQAFQRFTATLRSQPYSLNKAPSSSNINLHQSSRYLAAFPPHFQPQSKKKQYDLNDAKTQQLIQRHQQLVNKMEEEQQRRQTLLEKKRSSLTYDQQKKLEEEKKKHQKKKLKEEFLKKLEDEASRRQQFQQRLREVKERKAAEAASQQRETQLMGKEDVLMIQKKLREVQLQRERIFAASNNVNNNNTRKPKSATRNKVVVTESSQPAKKAAVPKVPHRPVETNKKPSEEKIMAAVMRVAVSEEEKARYTELLSKRIKEAKQQKLLEKQQQEVEEQEKKEKLEKFLQKYQEQLKEQKIAMKLKKKEEKRLKKLQKEKETREAGETGEGGDEEKDNDNDQEEGEGEVLAHVISSAPEEFKNIMEDFQFDDFMEKPDLIQIYSEDSPKHDLQAFPTEIIPSLPSPDVIDYKQSNHFQASSNIAQPATSLPPQQKKKVVTSKTKANKPADATSEQSIKRFYKINRDIFRMPRHLKSTPYYQHYVKYVKETENIPIDQILSREGGERDKDKDEKEKKRGGEKIAHASPRKEMSQSKIKEVVNEVEMQGEDEEEEQYGLLEMIQRAQEKKYGAANLPRQQQTVSQSNNTNNTQPQPTQTTQGTTIHKAISQPSLPTISDQKPVIPSSDMAMKHSSSTNQVTSALTVKAPVLKFTHNLPVPTIPTLNSLLTPHHTSSNLPQPTSEAFPLQSLPAPPLETMLNIKQRYGISIDDFATHLPNTTSNTMTAAGNHVSTIKKLKMKKLKAEKEQQTVVKNESNKMKKKENNKEENKKKKTKTSAASPNTLIIPLPRQKKPTRKEITMEGVMEVEGEEEEEGEGHSLAYSHDTLSVNIPSRQRKLSKRYSTPLAPLSSAINTNPATTTTSASSKKKRKESFPTSEEKGAVGAIKKELQEEQSKVKQKISELFDYEQQLQKDYADLKKQFQEKLQHAMMTSSSKGRGDDEEEEMEGGRLEVEVDEEGEVGEESSDSLIMMKGGRQEEVEREDDIMRKSITESYSEQVSNKMMSSSQPKVSTKDLLMEWAIEDAIEKGEINDDDLIALHQQKQLKYSEQGDDDDDEEEEEEDYEEEEERGEVDHEGGEAEGEDYEDEAEEGEEKDMPSEYDDDSYYDRRLNSLRGTSNNPSKPPTALSLSQHPIHEEEGEEDNELDEEEGSFDEDEDEEEYMRDERKEYWKQLLSLDQTAATSSSDKNNNNVSAQTTTQTQLDDYCLSMMNNLNAKISQK